MKTYTVPAVLASRIIKPFATPLIGVVLFIGVSVEMSSAAPLDFFLAPDQSIEVNSSILNDTDTDSIPYTLGTANTTRRLTQTVTQASVGGNLGTTSSIEGGLNAWSFNTGPGAAASGSVEWGADISLDLNLYSYGDRFVFENDWNDSDYPVLTLNVWVAGEGTPYSRSLTLPATNVPVSYTFPFSSFAGADFSHVDRISIEIVGQTGNDVGIRNFQIIPEPSGALLLGLTGVLASLRRGRKN